MSRDLSAIYDAAFFESYNEEQDTDIRAATDVIVDVLRPKTAIDIGCGPGMLVHRLRILGVDAVGVDGSANAYLKAKPEVRPYLEIADVTRVEYMKGADLVVCTEVAEHVPAERSDNLVSTLCRSAEKWVVFTAAPPGQGGHDHCNEQPMSYWIAKFEARGFEVDEVMTAAIKDGWEPLKRCWYYAANVRVFRRRP